MTHPGNANTEHFRQIIRENGGVFGEYLAVVAYYTKGDLSRALSLVAWIDERFGLGRFPDVLMAEIALRQTLSAADPEHRQVRSDDLRAIYEDRQLLGSMRATIINQDRSPIRVDSLQRDPSLWDVFFPEQRIGERARRGEVPGTAKVPFTAQFLPVIAASVPWTQFGIDAQFSDRRSVCGAWALNRALAGEYDEAEAVLGEHSAFDTPVHWIAAMALYYTTQRWTDLRTVAHEARTCPDEKMGYTADSPNPLLELNVRQVHDLGSLMAGQAEVSLGNNTSARSALAVASESSTYQIKARAHYLLGMIHRLDGDEDRATQHFSHAWSTFTDPDYERALRGSGETIRVTTEDLIGQRTDRWDVMTEPDPELEAKRQRESMRSTYLTRATDLLDQQIGMEEVKANVRRLMLNIKVTQERIRRGGGAKAANYNLVLTGAPGTGKSTIVDVLALFMAGMGIVDDPEPMVTHREDFVSDVVGGSAKQSKQTIANAKGKVLFIDEFYSLVQQADGPNKDQFGKEALDTIVAESETRIGDTVFIVAGYTADIDRIFRVNDGLSSRFPRRIDFPSYTLGEIAQIAQLQAGKEGMSLSDEAMEFLGDDSRRARVLMKNVGSSGQRIIDVLGNGRLARNLVETAISFQSERIATAHTDLTDVSHDDLFTLSLEDIEKALEQYLERALKT